MNDPSPLDRQVIGEISELIEIFPYFQTAHMLLLKGLHGTADVKFEKQLNRSAIHIADREVLYYLLKPDSGSLEGEKSNLQNSVTVEKEITDNQQTVIESAKSSDDYINEIEKGSISGLTADQNDINQQDISHSILVSTESEQDEMGSVMFIIDEEQGPIDEKINYMDPGFSFPERQDLLELDLDTTKEIMPETVSEDQDKITPEISDSRKMPQADLIDMFILANPKIGPVREKSNLPAEDLSKPYVEEQGRFVTETLAKIYIKQGYYSKAIDIYEKLCLKFPEKSSYFASQIEKVQELIKK
jgi:hypothetical protein